MNFPRGSSVLFKFPLRRFYASGGQGRNPCSPRIRFADADRSRAVVAKISEA
jgi:hypothetical protein